MTTEIPRILRWAFDAAFFWSWVLAATVMLLLWLRASLRQKPPLESFFKQLGDLFRREK